MTGPAIPPEFQVSFPVMWVALDWAEAHCVIPDGFSAGDPYKLADWQAWYLANFYRVKPGASLRMNGRPVPAVGAPAFHFRRAQVVMPQKAGKGPATACHVCIEAVGPALFAGWAKGDGALDEHGRLVDQYRCSDHGCHCGWTYTYAAGEPMGIPWPTPLIQITAYSEEQTGNVYDALRPMIEKGPLSEVIPRTGEEFIRLPGGGRIDTVTSSAMSRLGQRVTFCPQDETGLWLSQNKMVKVADTQRRGAAGMGGRTAETTNAWDPAEMSVAQLTAEEAKRKGERTDIFRLHREAPKHLRYTNREDRRRIHRYVYKGSWWVDLDAINSEAEELLARDPAQAERFFGNRIVAGLGQWMEEDKETGKTLWETSEVRRPIPPKGTEVAGGFDGSESDDHTGIRLETREGYRFTPLYGPDRRPTHWDPAEWGGSIPRGEVNAAVEEIARVYRLRRFYCDPRDWQTEIGDWALAYGDEVVKEWATYRIAPMHDALVRSLTDLRSGRSTHDACPITALHVGNARKLAKPGDRYILGKPHQHRKIDMAMADTLAHEAWSDWTLTPPEEPKGKTVSHAVYGFS